MILIPSKSFGNSICGWFKHSRLNGIRNNKVYFHLIKRNQHLKCPDDSKFTTRIAYPEDYENVVNFMSEAYYKHEPVMIDLGLSNVEPPASMLKCLYDQVKEGMTIIAEDQDNCILGAAVNAGSCPWDVERSMEFARCCACGLARDAIEFFAYVAGKPNLWERYSERKIFECCYLAVNPEFRGLGIGKRLVMESWYLARDCGYRLFRVDCSSRYTGKIAESFGWQKVCTIPYCRYVKNGKLVFKNVKRPHAEIQVYIDRVRFCKSYCLPCKDCKPTLDPKSAEEECMKRKMKKKK